MNITTYLKAFLKLSIPVILGQLGSVLMGITDMVMLGHVGKNHIAAVGVANQVYFMFMVFGLGAMAAIAPLVASSKGANQKRECGELLRTGIELSFLISIILCILLFVLIENFHILNQPPEINAIAVGYLRMISISTVPYLLFIALKQYSDGLMLTKPAMYITLFAVILNGLLNAVFIYGLFSFPASGALGAGIATLFSRIFMALALVVYIFRNETYSQFLPNLVSTFNTRPVIMRMLKIGIPSGIQMFFEIAAFTGTAIFVGWLGVNYLAAHQILLGILTLVYTLAVGFSVAGSVKVSHSRGKGDLREVRFWSKFTISIVFMVLLAMSLVMSIFNYEIILLFVKENEVLAIASSTFLVMTIFLVIDGLQVTIIGLLRSIEDVKMPTYVTLTSYIFLGLPLSYVFAFILDFSIVGIWIGLIAGGFLSSVILCFRFFILIKDIKSQNYKELELIHP
ncbi:MAG: MATE family efflux transporter [Cytophagaceae bacterium]|nr:MATE family efflux transporter [Cytophagaceae bacterium]